MSRLSPSRREALAGGLLALLAGGPALTQSGPVVARFRVEGGRVLIDAVINGKGPFPFILDTGAVVSGIMEKTAKEIGLKKIRDVKLKGDSFPIYAADEVILGGAVRMPDVALAGLWRLGGGIGLLAAGLVTAFDSELDFDTSEWRVFPQGAGERPGFTAIPSDLPDHPGANGSRRIEADALYGEEKLSLLWDTGGPWPLKVDHKAAVRLGLWNDDRPWCPIPVTGITGTQPAPGRLVRADKPIRVGPLSFENQLVSLGAPDHPNSSWGSDEDGLLGLPILQRMNIAVDAKARKVLVKSSGRPSTDPRYNRSGVWIDNAGGKIIVGQVGRGSPGEKAGLKRGDKLAGEWRDLLKTFGGEAGTNAVVTIEGRGPVTIALADYL